MQQWNVLLLLLDILNGITSRRGKTSVCIKGISFLSLKTKLKIICFDMTAIFNLANKGFCPVVKLIYHFILVAVFFFLFTS